MISGLIYQHSRNKIGNMKKIFALLLGCICTIMLHAQNFQYKWARRSGDPSTMVNSVLNDIDGNVYTTGTFTDTAVDFDPGTGIYKLYNNHPPNTIGYVCKLSPQGTFIAAKKFCAGLTSNYYSGGTSAMDPAGNIYVTGSFYNQITFYTATGNITLGTSGNWDVFLCKLDPSFNVLWAKKMGGTGDDVGAAIAVGATGNVYITGFFQGYGNFDPGSSNTSLWALYDDVFVCKFNSSGNFNWVKGLGGTGNEQGKSIALDTMENVFTTGYFTGTADFDPSATTNFYLTSAYAKDVFISKLDSAGNYKWAGRIGASNDEIGNSITVDRQGNVITAGWYISATDVDPGPGTTILPHPDITFYGYYLVKMDNNCNFIWGKQLGGSSYIQTISLAVDTLNNIYATGSYTDSADFDTGPGFNYLTTSNSVYGNQDDFVAKVNTTGQCIWVAGFGNNFQGELAKAISVDKSANVYTAGIFSDTVDFDPSAGVDILISSPTSPFGSPLGIYIQKLGQCYNTASTLHATACDNYTYNGQTYTTSGNYAHHYINAGGCDSTVTLNLTINTVNTNVSQSGSTLTAAQANGVYQWVQCPDFILIPGASGQAYTATSGGSYAVIITTTSGCRDTSNCNTVVAADVNELNRKGSLRAFPNPAKDMVYLTAGHSFNNASIIITSILGETVFTADHIDGIKAAVNVSSMKTGTYFITVRDCNETNRIQLQLVK